MRPLVRDKPVKCHDPSLNRFREIPPEAIRGGIFDFFPHNFQPDVGNDVISSMAVDNVGMNDLVILGQTVFRDIRGADFVSNEHWRSLSAFRLKIVRDRPLSG